MPQHSSDAGGAGQGGPHPLLAALTPWEGLVEPGWTVNWLGVRTRLGFQEGVRGFDVASHVATAAPAASEDMFEWIDVVEAVAESAGTFAMVELGAGWGRWLVNAAAVSRATDPTRRLVLVGVEAEPTHFQWLAQHFVDNGIDPADHVLLRAAVAATDGTVRFQHGDPAGWYGQAIDRDDPAAKQAGPVSRLIRWSRNTTANALARGAGARRTRRVRAASLSTVLADFEAVDLVDADIQGVEADVFEAAAETLNAKVRRVHVGTHGPENEERLRVLFGRLGWECRFDYPGGGERETPWGPVRFEDGAQSWVNPARRARE